MDFRGAEAGYFPGPYSLSPILPGFSVLDQPWPPDEVTLLLGAL